MSKICTTIEQSQQLIELGIDINTADMFWDVAEPNKRRKPMIGPISDYYNMDDWAVSAWSLGALLELLPDKIQVDNENYYLILHKTNVEYRGPITWDGQKSITFGGANLIGAIFEAICWLKMKNKL